MASTCLFFCCSSAMGPPSIVCHLVHLEAVCLQQLLLQQLQLGLCLCMLLQRQGSMVLSCEGVQ